MHAHSPAGSGTCRCFYQRHRSLLAPSPGGDRMSKRHNRTTKAETPGEREGTGRRRTATPAIPRLDARNVKQQPRVRSFSGGVPPVVARPMIRRGGDLLSQRKGSLLQPMCSLSWPESEAMFVYLCYCMDRDGVIDWRAYTWKPHSLPFQTIAMGPGRLLTPAVLLSHRSVLSQLLGVEN